MSASGNNIELSYCITCKNRKSQLQATLRRNLDDNASDSTRVEFVLIDFDTPGVSEWITSEFQSELKSGYLRYFFSKRLQYWSAPIAKNTSHRYARGKILVNLDVDNFTGKGNARYLIQVFDKYGPDILFHQRDPDRSPTSSYGRIALSAESFAELGGYNEKLGPVGFQDTDLIHRFSSKWPQRRVFAFLPDQHLQQQQQGRAYSGVNAINSVSVNSSVTSDNGGGSLISGSAKSCCLDIIKTDDRCRLLFPPSGCPSFVAQDDQTKLANVEPGYLRVMKKRGFSYTELKRWMMVQNRNVSNADREEGRFTSNIGLRYIGVDPKHVSTLGTRTDKPLFFLNLNGHGLCNRLRTLLSYAYVAYHLQTRLFFLWTPDEACPGKYEDYFEAIGDYVTQATNMAQFQAHIAKYTASGEDGGNSGGNNNPSSWTPADQEIVLRPNSNTANRFRLIAVRGARVFSQVVKQYMLPLARPWRAQWIKDRLRLVPRLNKQVLDIVRDQRFAERQCMGVHMRRTDHVQLAQQKGLYQGDDEFLARIQQKNASFVFLATDNAATQASFSRLLAANQIQTVTAGSITTSGGGNTDDKKKKTKNSRHTSLERAVLDLFLLSHCSQLVLTPYSSFSDIALDLWLRQSNRHCQSWLTSTSTD